MNLQLPTDWQDALRGYTDTKQFKSLIAKVRHDYKNKTVYPPQEYIFNAFKNTKLHDVKVVILGQDPYHNEGQAHGLSFSVPEGVPAPPSLKNIFKELNLDKNVEVKPLHFCQTDLTRWATQGVFLLNSVLTVLKGQPASHSCLGTTTPNGLRSGSWQDFTDHVIKTISDSQENVVFLLWGSYARSKATLIDTNKHLVLEAPHPSPLSAYRGFLGCKHFSKANAYLMKHGKKHIEW